ncbi:hypothetical protein WICMUC_004460 [Wickerhamomyces mucosus]|uniref:RNA helicase n=1 Tax=Wickerhamomyces mucosus TaxID=1378264 RepID=A0A9P8PIS7_9ASCO|nr:hypothetical protein WICMUC_004460 [Wickerhamomyces mucosus]
MSETKEKGEINERHVVNTQQNGEAQKDPSTNNHQSVQSSEDVKKQERLKKLEAWKKKQQEKKKQQANTQKLNTVPKVAVATKAKFSFKKKVSKKEESKPIKKSALFELNEQDEEKSKKSFYIPTREESNSNEKPEDYEIPDADEVDALDAFMNEIEGNSKVQDGRQDDLIEEAEEIEETEENYEEDEANKLLKKLKSKKSRSIQIPKYDLKTLEKFPKNFLIDLNTIDQDEIINFRALNNIFINNNKINPVLNFYHFGLDTEILNVLTNQLKFENPTPIQSQTIPAIMSGNDVIGIGKTGSGKTMCYLLSMLKHIKQQRPLGKEETGPMGLILSPTRELAIQIFETIEVFLKNNSMKAICCTGGSELYKQINDLKKGVEIIVATPGRFIDLLTLNNGKLLKTNRITYVTLDEADRLFDLGFEPQINQIMKTIRPDKQCVLFSATFPKKLQDFAVKTLKKPIIIGVGNKQDVNENIKQIGKSFTTEVEKFQYLLQLLSKQPDNSKTIIFCDSQIQVNFMNNKLLEQQFDPIAIHAGLAASDRSNNLSKFKKNSKKNILICTEVLSRGLDVQNVKLVILYNAAKTFAQYVHSTGRTARGNSKGTAITLLSKDEELQAYVLMKYMKEEDLDDERILEMANNFEKDLKSGKKKISSGYGGKGLDNLEKLRDETEKTERKKLGEDQIELQKSDKIKNDDDEIENDDDDDDYEIEDPNLEIVYNDFKNDISKGLFNAKITINDLPQNVRWLATNNTALNKVIEETFTSVTYKGKYYPTGEGPKDEKDEPKLYLLIEAEKSDNVLNAIELVKNMIIDGLKKLQKDNRNGKFSL